MVATYPHPDDRPQRYTLNSKQLLSAIGKNAGWLAGMCNRQNNPIPHILAGHVNKRWRYFDPAEVKTWFATLPAPQ